MAPNQGDGCGHQPCEKCTKHDRFVFQQPMEGAAKVTTAVRMPAPRANKNGPLMALQASLNSPRRTQTSPSLLSAERLFRSGS